MSGHLLESFKDANLVSAYAKSGVAASVNAGLVIGRNGNLDPQHNMTRAEVAVIVKRLLEKSGLI
ncbi:S-layer homology domain-containing protein [Paenibacillaceae bacterium]|nr:S-layer homology domain-containing protein [Paenibacillaceae bacterium]